MEIMKWDPFRDMVSIRDEIDRLFDGFFGRMPAKRSVMKGIWAPLVDIEETKDDILIRAELPGMKKEDIKISVSEGRLQIAGERSKEKEEKEGTYHRIERTYGRFQRVVPLPVEVEAGKTKATYKDGMLEVRLPKAEKAKPKEIGIEVK
ncbi:Hsp20/alpha crystallin family protein [candidate division TA06 bacterium]|uniref:Hsp20/alpha crystallin family protein n=1 Tax=candidate division TA06 bacterium TaxID=2250710 RepID=A0A523UNW3_UNCT6|nr:MAG: Hsp20/alpha crystallin family protein [candidate division TA06 bacterium]